MAVTVAASRVRRAGRAEAVVNGTPTTSPGLSPGPAPGPDDHSTPGRRATRRLVVGPGPAERGAQVPLALGALVGGAHALAARQQHRPQLMSGLEDALHLLVEGQPGPTVPVLDDHRDVGLQQG